MSTVRQETNGKFDVPVWSGNMNSHSAGDAPVRQQGALRVLVLRNKRRALSGVLRDTRSETKPRGMEGQRGVVLQMPLGGATLS